MSVTSSDLLDGLRHAIKKLQEPPNPGKCFRCGYVDAHDPYCLENPVNAERRAQINEGLGKWLESTKETSI